jgi:hypothetical protein
MLSMLSAGLASRLTQRSSDGQCGSAKGCHNPESMRFEMRIELARGERQQRCWDADADGAVDC